MSSGPSRGRVRRWAVRSALALGALVLALALAEAALSLDGGFRPDPPLYLGDRESGTPTPDLGLVDPELGWRLAPHQVIVARHPDHAGVVYRANGQGFRSEVEFERNAPAPQGLARIAFVGDSFTFGLGVEAEQTFARLVAAARAPAQALNLGQAGYGIDQMERVLALWALALAPDLVVVSFVDDDLQRSLCAYCYRGGWIQKPTYVLERGCLRPMEARDRPCAPLRWLEQHTRLAEAWRQIAARLARHSGFDYRWRLNLALFARMQAQCAQARVPLVIVRIPQRGRWSPAPAYRRDLEALGIPVLDLGDERPPDPRALFFQSDGHLNAQGHRYVAVRLARFLADLGLP